MVASNAHQYLSSLSCEVGIIKAKNIEFNGGGVFVRYYLSRGNNKRSIQLNSKEISPSKSDDDECLSHQTWKYKTGLSWFQTRRSVKTVLGFLIKVNHVNLAAPSLQVSMKLDVVDHQVLPKMVEKKNKKNKSSSWWVDECGYSDDQHHHGGCNCADYEIFALVAALETL
ncbi:hypothetical protein QYF36_019412 [Acer negundo]|nr:hypothetical protein QYF36_019412 [Acer negundo]